MKHKDFMFRRLADEPTVFVRPGDQGLEIALRILKRKVQLYGGLKALRFRQQHPNRRDRRRFKRRKATQQFIRAEKIRGLKQID